MFTCVPVTFCSFKLIGYDLDILVNLHTDTVVVVDVFGIKHVAFKSVSTFPSCNDNIMSSSNDWVLLQSGHNKDRLNWYVPLKYLFVINHSGTPKDSNERIEIFKINLSGEKKIELIYEKSIMLPKNILEL